MSKIQDAYQKSLDFILATMFKFWYWLGCKLEVTIEVPQPEPWVITKYEYIKGEAGVDPETHQAVKAERDELLKTNQQLKWALDGHHGVQPTDPQRPNNNQKLSDREVTEIRDMKRRGWKNVELATAFDVNPATISRIVRNQYHRNLAVA